MNEKEGEGANDHALCHHQGVEPYYSACVLPPLSFLPLKKRKLTYIQIYVCLLDIEFLRCCVVGISINRSWCPSSLNDFNGRGEEGEELIDQNQYTSRYMCTSVFIDIQTRANFISAIQCSSVMLLVISAAFDKASYLDAYLQTFSAYRLRWLLFFFFSPFSLYAIQQHYQTDS